MCEHCPKKAYFTPSRRIINYANGTVENKTIPLQNMDNVSTTDGSTTLRRADNYWEPYSYGFEDDFAIFEKYFKAKEMSVTPPPKPTPKETIHEDGVKTVKTNCLSCLRDFDKLPDQVSDVCPSCYMKGGWL